VREKMEGALGTDFSDVRVHEGAEADAAGAVAYTRGSDIHFAPGAFSPGSAEGQRLLGHELAHVVQQREGRVAAPGGGAAPINEDPSLEAEADALGARAARSRAPLTLGRVDRPAGPSPSPSPAAALAQPAAGAKPGGVAQLLHGKKKQSTGGASNKQKHDKSVAAGKKQASNANFKAAKAKGSKLSKSVLEKQRKGKKR
jgi:hypothetical protein